MAVKVAYCGGKWIPDGSDPSKTVWSAPKKSNVSNITSSWSPTTTAKNETDADAYILDNSTGSYKLHIFKSKCSPRMKCTYKSGNNGKIINDNTNIWKKVVNNGQFQVMADYLGFSNSGTSNEYRIGSYESSAAYSGFASPTSIEFWFINVDEDSSEQHGDIPLSTTIEMFADCTGLTSCEIPGQMRIIDGHTFQGCTSLTSYTQCPEFLETINEWAFNNCTSLPTLTIGRNAYIDGGNAFSNCTAATAIDWGVSSTEYKYNMTDIPSYTFNGCSSLYRTIFTDKTVNAIIIPKGITSAGTHSFSNCTSIRGVDFSHTDNFFIEDYAFAGCSSLTGISGFSKVDYVGLFAFQGAASATTTSTFDGLTNVKSFAESAMYGVYFNGEIVLQAYNMGAYAFQNTTVSGNVTFNNSSFTTVPEGAFYDSKINGYVKFNYNITLGSNAFKNCGLLSAATFNGTATLGAHCFENCTSLKNLTFYKNGFSASSSTAAPFNGCTGVTGVTLENGVTMAVWSNKCFYELSDGLTVTIKNTSSTPVSNLGDAFSSSKTITFKVPNSSLVTTYRNAYPSSTYSTWTFTT